MKIIKYWPILWVVAFILTCFTVWTGAHELSHGGSPHQWDGVSCVSRILSVHYMIWLRQLPHVPSAVLWPLLVFYLVWISPPLVAKSVIVFKQCFCLFQCLVLWIFKYLDVTQWSALKFGTKIFQLKPMRRVCDWVEDGPKGCHRFIPQANDFIRQ